MLGAWDFSVQYCHKYRQITQKCKQKPLFIKKNGLKLRQKCADKNLLKRALHFPNINLQLL